MTSEQLTPDRRTREQPIPRWYASSFHRRLLTAGLFGVVLAVLLGRPAFAVLAAAPLWLAFSVRPALAGALDIAVSLDQSRCFESDVVVVSAIVEADTALSFDVALRTPPGVSLLDGVSRSAVQARHAQFSWTMRANRWGRWPLGPVAVRAHTTGLLSTAHLMSSTCSLTIFPPAVSLQRKPLPRTFPNRLGDHVSRAVGDGVEFGGIRPFVPGDTVRHLNWRATARHGRPYVTQFNAERACELVIVVDGFSDVGPRGHGSLDIAVRGAASLAQSYLADHDRVGVIALGGILRWVGGQAGGSQFYRVVEALLDVRDFVSVVRPSLDRIPRAVLPPGSLVVLFSPLLDERAIEIVRDLRQRRFPLVVIDVLNTAPSSSLKGDASNLAARLWQLERYAMRGRLTDLGVHVVGWDGGKSLAAVLASLPPPGRIA